MSCTDGATPPWPKWRGQTAVCIATGPSLKAQQVETVRQSGVRTIGINDVGLTHDWIDIWYAADLQFWAHYKPTSKALRVCAEKDGRGLYDRFLDVNNREKALQYIPGYALHGEHSGFQALQLAISLGAKRVVLLGYDCKPKGQVTNYFGTKCAKLQRPSNYGQWPLHYERLAIPGGVEVLNATPGSAITAYPFVDIGAAVA